MKTIRTLGAISLQFFKQSAKQSVAAAFASSITSSEDTAAKTEAVTKDRRDDVSSVEVMASSSSLASSSTREKTATVDADDEENCSVKYFGAVTNAWQWCIDDDDAAMRAMRIVMGAAMLKINRRGAFPPYL